MFFEWIGFVAFWKLTQFLVLRFCIIKANWIVVIN